MSDWNPKAPYIYQPEAVYAKDGSENKRIYGLAGPGAEKYFFSGQRFTREEAEKELNKLLSKMKLDGSSNDQD